MILLDGVRYSVNMAGIAIDRLWEVLQRIDQDFEKATGDDTAEAALYAWSIVDAAHRMGSIIDGLPGLKKSGWPRLLKQRMASVETFRNAWQHQLTESGDAVARRDQAFGAIAWVKHVGPKPTAQWNCIVAGSDFKGSSWKFVGPMKKIPRVSTRRIRLLYNGGEEIYLARVVRDMVAAIRSLEDDLKEGRIKLVGEMVNQKRQQDAMFQSWIEVLVSINSESD